MFTKFKGAGIRLLIHGALLSSSAFAQAAALTITTPLTGYTSISLELGRPYAGAVAFDPSVGTRMYASVGSFGNQSVLRVDTTLGTTATVLTGLGSVGGMAILSNADLVFTENGTSQSIFRARDLNADLDFLDAGEVTELIAPILADSGFGFTGAQIAVAPAGNASAIPAGSLVIQTADGGTSGELLVVENPTSATPAYRPVSSAYFSGFGYNGGVAFDPSGNLVMGESVYPAGKVYGLVNTNVDQQITSGTESHVLVDTAAIPNGIADLAVSAQGRVFFGGNGLGFGTADAPIRTFQLPGNLLTGSGTPSTFAGTNSVYLSTLRFDNAAKTFAAGATVNTARLIVGGLDTSFYGFTNLLIIQPGAIAAVQDWAAFE